MTDRETNLRRAAAAVSRSIATGPDDDEHPAYEVLEALVDGRLEAADLEAVQSHVETCRICAEDVADLSGMRDAMPASSPASATPAWRPYMVAVASIAAVFVMAVWFSDWGPESSAPSGTLATGPAPSPAPAPVARASALTPNEQAIVAKVVENGRLDLPAPVSALSGSVGTLLGRAGDQSLSPIGPVGTAVLSARPTFSWHSVPDALSYSIAVYDERFTEVARSPRLDAPTWTPVTDLPIGRTLAWQITAKLTTGDVTGPKPPQPEARFLVIDSATAATIVDQLSRLANEPLPLGILLARAGLVDEASRVLERAAADATLRPQAQPLLDQLKRQ